MLQIDEQAVIRKIKQGEIDQFAVIVNTYTQLIKNFIAKKLYEKAEVDDLVQNVFISFYKAIAHFDESKPILPYLIQIARNEIKMYWRSHKETLSLKEEIVQDEEEVWQEDVESVIELLSEEQKKALQLVYEGYSYKEIATTLNKPLNTVRTIIRRARLAVTKKHEITGR